MGQQSCLNKTGVVRGWARPQQWWWEKSGRRKHWKKRSGEERETPREGETELCLGTQGSAPQTACWCYRYLTLFRELSKTQGSSVGLAFRAYVTNCLGSRLENSQENWIFQENDSLIKRSKVWCIGANFQKTFQIVKIFFLVIAVKTYENSNLRHLASAFFLVHNVPWVSVPSKPMETKLAMGMIVSQAMVCRDVQRCTAIELCCQKIVLLGFLWLLLLKLTNYTVVWKRGGLARRTWG